MAILPYLDATVRMSDEPRLVQGHLLTLDVEVATKLSSSLGPS